MAIDHFISQPASCEPKSEVREEPQELHLLETSLVTDEQGYYFQAIQVIKSQLLGRILSINAVEGNEPGEPGPDGWEGGWIGNIDLIALSSEPEIESIAEQCHLDIVYCYLR